MIKVKLLKLMKERGMDAKQLIELTGLTRQTVKALMSEYHARVDLDTLEKLCQALQCGPGDLLQIEKD